ncbi:methyltransferase [Nonomuraea sp. SBT364]|uniref:methyltransferase n=1 Tax=Nonomuraea sp. SBT364 TaxID=1580530 RepID=UPI00066C525F|nr:methyltransferase [Nonomuraea sp. SBT364]
MTDGYASLARTAFGYAGSQILYAAVRLGVPDALAGGPVPVGKLADALGADPAALKRLARALVVLGVVREAPPGQLALAEAGRPLCADHPRSMRSSVLLFGDPAVWRAWGALHDSVLTGEPAFDQVHGLPLFDHLAGDAGLSRIFNTAMREGTGHLAAEVPRAYDCGGARVVVDIGGGDGTLLAAILTAVPGARGILYDTAQGGAGAGETFRRANVAERCTVEAGDFFAGVPGGDLMLLKGILHDWDDRRCATLLRRCREAIHPGGRLLVIEPVMPARLDAPDAAGAVMSDIAMLVYTGGRERDRAEFGDLLAAGGFAPDGLTAPLGGTAIRVLAARPV